MDSKKSNKIRDIVRLQQLLKKWKKFAKNSNQARIESANSSPPSSSSKSIKFLKKTLSFSDRSVSPFASNDVVVKKGFLKKTLSFSDRSASPFASNDVVVKKGFLAVCVGKDLKRYVIPTEYLSHQAFGVLLREAEEEFGFQQEGVLKIPCEDSVFQMILKAVEQKREDPFTLNEDDLLVGGRCSPDQSENFQSSCVPTSNAQMIH